MPGKQKESCAIWKRANCLANIWHTDATREKARKLDEKVQYYATSVQVLSWLTDSVEVVR